ncbi:MULTISPECIES: hypothetical protein [Mycobacteroides]|jgi:hypothetical protein|uniref:Uncharacterized protein n=1 Tax=Mycobacteroides chelonae TaxID=1774 RepID=A0A1S1M6I5_MYCCH|nr:MULTISPECIES: hypothetical protein [Mycobacteroides]PKQ57906.1 hypothetical protein B5566_10895 [Mycobacterium sp. MHSD3]SKN81225.1 Uncharacterised protein [Mycobacteroides abscessus subsp. bolletii]KRQ20012.1 hypothetical protein AOT86_24000 [Mycobacteroides sp. H072]KRQ26541.1 hypothetical protein AOT87_00430 [Mycobacteroides sp. H003]KRQ29744.1 hypothetical protein AOT84_26040 [Mycobacteroides sp. H002]
MIKHLTRRATVALVVAAAAMSPAAYPAVADTATPLNGLFALTPGSCAEGRATGSYFRMILPAGDASGPYLANGDSTCSDNTVTLLAPGTDGGLKSGEYQPQPGNAFDGNGNAVSGSITQPVKFYGVGFATASNQTDPQTGQGTATPQITVSGNKLGGDLSAFGVTWNNQVFNQGSPKPGGAFPGKTTPVTGTYDRNTGAFIVEWTSQIVGGPFNDFTGLWHLVGKVGGSPGGAAVAEPPPPPPPGAPPAAADAPPAVAAPAAPGQVVVQAGQQVVAPPPLSAGQQLIALPVDDNPRTITPPWVIALLVFVAIGGGILFVVGERIFSRGR